MDCKVFLQELDSHPESYYLCLSMKKLNKRNNDEKLSKTKTQLVHKAFAVSEDSFA